MNMYADVLIVGTGVAGLYTSLNLKNNLKIVMVTKNTLDDCNSYFAQGGIATARDREDIEGLIQDTLEAGQYKNNEQAVRILAEESIININNLISLGVKFDMKDDELHYTREGAHRVNRIVHCKDKTGEDVTKTLIENVKSKRNITIIENAELVDLINKGDTCIGGKILKHSGEVNIIAKATVLCTGGIGGLFLNSTNSRSLVGEGLGIAIRNNIEVSDISFIQFHPTSLYSENEGRRFLISEAVRGEGAYLKNVYGDRFVNELLPRDVVSKAIIDEEKSTMSKFVYLDITHREKDYIINRFPTIYCKCKELGIDITKDKIPVTPAQHYFMGGIRVDTFSRTSMKNLYASGEVSCTGVHGANRLASNSLLEALVFSRRAAIAINRSIGTMKVLHKNEGIETHTDNLEGLLYINKKTVIEEIIKVRGDLKNELVSC